MKNWKKSNCPQAGMVNWLVNTPFGIKKTGKSDYFFHHHHDPLGILFPLVIVALGAGFFMFYLRSKSRVVDDIVVNMVDVGEETGELDTMLYKVADTYEDEVKTLTEGLVSIMEPLLIVFLGGAVGFIVIALFLPLISLITTLSG